MDNTPAKKCLTRDDLINLVTAQILAQVNQNSANLLAKISVLQESVDAIARQVAREIPD